MPQSLFYNHQYNVLRQMLPLNSQNQCLFLFFVYFIFFCLLFLEMNIICPSHSFVSSISTSGFLLTTVSASGFPVNSFFLKIYSELSKEFFFPKLPKFALLCNFKCENIGNNCQPNEFEYNFRFVQGRLNSTESIKSQFKDPLPG